MSGLVFGLGLVQGKRKKMKEEEGLSHKIHILIIIIVIIITTIILIIVNHYNY